MIVEYTRYQVADEQRSALERAYERAQSVLITSPHCLGYELSRCLEEPTSYMRGQHHRVITQEHIVLSCPHFPLTCAP